MCHRHVYTNSHMLRHTCLSLIHTRNTAAVTGKEQKGSREEGQRKEEAGREREWLGRRQEYTQRHVHFLNWGHTKRGKKLKKCIW